MVPWQAHSTPWSTGGGEGGTGRAPWPTTNPAAAATATATRSARTGARERGGGAAASPSTGMISRSDPGGGPTSAHLAPGAHAGRGVARTNPPTGAQVWTARGEVEGGR